MMEKIKYSIRRLIYHERASTKEYVLYLRNKGCKIGEGVIFHDVKTAWVDVTRPWLIDIGNHVHITRGVTILTHGHDLAVLKRYYGEVLGCGGGVTIGNNVFIGMHSTILKGTTIGNNVIIGANSLVNKNIPDNCVAAGNPCKVIMSLDEYYHKRKKAQIKEATEIVNKYRERYGKEPDPKALHEFFWLFSDGKSELPEEYKYMMRISGNEQLSYERLTNNYPVYSCMQEFLESIPKKTRD